MVKRTVPPPGGGVTVADSCWVDVSGSGTRFTANAVGVLGATGTVVVVDGALVVDVGWTTVVVVVGALVVVVVGALVVVVVGALVVVVVGGIVVVVVVGGADAPSSASMFPSADLAPSGI